MDIVARWPSCSRPDLLLKQLAKVQRCRAVAQVSCSSWPQACVPLGSEAPSTSTSCLKLHTVARLRLWLHLSTWSQNSLIPQLPEAQESLLNAMYSCDIYYVMILHELFTPINQFWMYRPGTLFFFLLNICGQERCRAVWKNYQLVQQLGASPLNCAVPIGGYEDPRCLRLLSTHPRSLHQPSKIRNWMSASTTHTHVSLVHVYTQCGCTAKCIMPCTLALRHDQTKHIGMCKPINAGMAV